MSNIITGYDAIEYAEQTGAELHKYADPTEAARDGLTIADAREVAAEDPSLIWVETTEGASAVATFDDWMGALIEGDGADDIQGEPMNWYPGAGFERDGKTLEGGSPDGLNFASREEAAEYFRDAQRDGTPITRPQ